MKIKRLLALVLASTLILGGCGESEETVAKKDVVELTESALNAPQVTEVVRGDMQVVTYYDAQIGPRIEQLKFERDGVFGEYHVRVGDTVQKGDVLATPLTEEYEKQVEACEKALEQLKVTYNYNKTSIENNIAIVKQQMTSIYKQLEKLQNGTEEYSQACRDVGEWDAELKILNLQLAQLQETYALELPHYEKQLKQARKECAGNVIKAPFDGVIVALEDVMYGEGIDSDLYYVALADTSVTYARCEYVSNSMQKQLVRTTLWQDGKEYELAPIPLEDSLYMQMRNNGETIYSEFRIADENADVQYGDYGKVKLITAEKKDVLMIPQTALLYSGGTYYVYKDVEGQSQKTIVKTGRRDDLRVEITEGLEEGDLVYVQE